MSDPRWIAAALLAIVLTGSARLLWSQRRTPHRSRATLAALLVLQLTTTTALYLTLVPPPTQAVAGRLTVLTANATLPAGTTGNVIALPEARPATAGQHAPDLASALRQHPGTAELQLVGDGLAARDRDTRLPGQVTRLPGPPPRGWVALHPPATTAPGAVFGVQARAQGVAGARAELLDPAGSVVDRAPVGADGRVHLTGVARARGHTVFSLRLLDAATHVVDTVPVPLQTADPAPLRVLIAAGAPGPEVKYLRRWAVDTGLEVQTQTSAGAGVSLGDPAVAITSARLADTDVLVLDARSLAALSAAQRDAVQQALRGGLGVLVRGGDALPDNARQLLRRWGLAVTGNTQRAPLHLPADPEATLLQARRGPQRPSAATTAYIDDADATSRSATLPALEHLTLHAADASPLLHDARGKAVGAWRAQGQGRLALLPLTDSYQLVLAGRDDRHAELWSGVLATVARPLPGADTTARASTATPWAGERMVLCGIAETADVVAPGGERVPLHVDPRTGPDRCAAYWPQQAGWHTLQQGDTSQAFYVFSPASATALHRQQVRDATAVRITGGPVAGVQATTPVPGPRWPWLTAFVLLAGVLWWVERRHNRTPVA